jgi:mono/diheme cytochrome c family protein
MGSLIKRLFSFLVLAGFALLGAGLYEGFRQPSAVSVPAGARDVERGKYLIAAAGCIACHTEEKILKDGGPILAGGRPLKTPFGTFYGPNITRDAATGIGKWSDADFLRAFREGRSPAGHNYYPSFPYTSFAGATDADLLDIKAYIFSLPAVARPNTPHDLALPFRLRFGLTYWKWLFFRAAPFKPDPAKSAEWNRGAYLVLHLGHCGECHTPRNLAGGMSSSRFLAGNPDGPEGGVVPNITPDAETGLGKWSEADLVSYLKQGITPDGDFVGGAMTEVILHGTGKLTDADRKAMAVYLRSVPAVANKVERKK